MEENTIMNNEEVLEATEEIVKATSNGGFKKATTIGLAMLAGGLACHFIVEPAVAKFKIWRANRNITVTQQQEDFYDEETVENEEDSE